jgi:hypothetical protein
MTASDDAGKGPGPGTLAEKVEWLIQNLWPSNQPSPTTNMVIAKAITEVTGEDVSHASIWKLRTGRASNPTLRTLNALKSFFKLKTIAYFDDDAGLEAADDQVVLLALLRDDDTARALWSLAELSPADRKMVVEMISSVARRGQ